MSENTDPIDSQFMRDLLLELRGPKPAKCDFCDKETPEDDLHPEEGGQWVCITCWERWEKEDAAIRWKEGQ